MGCEGYNEGWQVLELFQPYLHRFVILLRCRRWWWWLQHPSKDDEPQVMRNLCDCLV